MRKRNIYAVILALALFVSAYLVWTAYGPNGQYGAKTITVNIDHLEGDDVCLTFSTRQPFLRPALEEIHLIGGVESQYGLWVTTVDGETADEAKQQWWGYCVNGVDALYGVEQQPIADGDVIDFTLHVGW